MVVGRMVKSLMVDDLTTEIDMTTFVKFVGLIVPSIDLDEGALAHLMRFL